MEDGLKAIAVYRGCKRTQPLSTNLKQATSTGRVDEMVGEISGTIDPLAALSDDERAMVLAMREKQSRPAGPPVARRHKLAERMSFSHKMAKVTAVAGAIVQGPALSFEMAAGAGGKDRAWCRRRMPRLVMSAGR